MIMMEAMATMAATKTILKTKSSARGVMTAPTATVASATSTTATMASVSHATTMRRLSSATTMVFQRREPMPANTDALMPENTLK